MGDKPGRSTVFAFALLCSFDFPAPRFEVVFLSSSDLCRLDSAAVLAFFAGLPALCLSLDAFLFDEVAESDVLCAICVYFFSKRSRLMNGPNSVSTPKTSNLGFADMLQEDLSRPSIEFFLEHLA
jgi:hypothetical protein